MDLSRAKRRSRELYELLGARLEVLLGRGPLFAASLYEHRTVCGKPRCKCARGPYRHRQWCLSFLEEGRSRTRVVPKAIRADVERLTGDYRRFRRARRELAALFAELIGHVDAVGQARCERGTRRYARLVEKAEARGASSRSTPRGKGG